LRTLLHRTAIAAALGFGTAMSAMAAEVEGLAGELNPASADGLTYSWQLEYRQPLSDQFSASFSWLNEGHITDNHRDGQAVQFWWRSDGHPRGLSFSLGAGPYAYYNTTRPGPATRFEDAHGLALLTSAEAEWYFANGWVSSLRLNRVDARRSFDSTAILAGLGYRFDEEATPGDNDTTDALARFHLEFDGSYGKTVRNSFRSPDAATEGVGVRADASDHFAVSLGFIDANGARLGWNSATTAQIWLGTNLSRDFRVEAGLGGLFPVDATKVDGHSLSSDPSAMVSIAGAYSLSPHWIARLIWDRVGTGDSRDADIVLVSVGYRF
jgi:hypothetical protein